PNEDARIGDMVFIEETRPLSKLKRFRLVKILRSVKKVANKRREGLPKILKKLIMLLPRQSYSEVCKNF
ncbi:MAG: 30S ribosomal protein S17, partial [Pigeon pea little leaf phytoplasma]|nr:30S ribosomal protein S17 [Pigeon pea little leaf phytoplasma]